MSQQEVIIVHNKHTDLEVDGFYLADVEDDQEMAYVFHNGEHVELEEDDFKIASSAETFNYFREKMQSLEDSVRIIERAMDTMDQKFSNL